MTKRIFFLLILALTSGLVQAQNKERFKKSPQKQQPAEEENEEEPVANTIEEKSTASGFDWNKVVYGGNFSLTFGSNTFVYVSPSVGYKISDRFLAGAGFIYQYARVSIAYNPNNNTFQRLSEPFESQIYGPKIFGTFFPTDYLFTGFQYEYLNHDQAFFDPNVSNIFFQNVWTSVLFLEGGFAQELGRKGYIMLGLRYNILHDFDSPYASPWTPVIGLYF